MPTSVCPECSEEVFVDAEIEQGDSVVCEECNAKLVVVGLDPIELDQYDEEAGDETSRSDDFHSYEYDDDRY
jgi:alpha-aminoadipate/glutamate carrier protein LysW